MSHLIVLGKTKYLLSLLMTDCIDISGRSISYMARRVLFYLLTIRIYNKSKTIKQNKFFSQFCCLVKTNLFLLTYYMCSGGSRVYPIMISRGNILWKFVKSFLRIYSSLFAYAICIQYRPKLSIVCGVVLTLF